ncbi:hypothetical protein MYX77_02575 [Acidobacteriia bacterium AH_259_A11_L15]|nr:hypothetical protein [Acidobacteriia bacterium AH_259_A11_L15]
MNVAEELAVDPDVQLDNATVNLEAVSLWHRLQGEENATFVQRIAVVSPSGREVGGGEIEFVLTKPRHRVYARIQNLPVPELGEYQFKLWLRRQEQEEWGEHPVSTYYLTVKRK